MYGWNSINSLLDHPIGNNVDNVSVEATDENKTEGEKRHSVCINFMVTKWDMFEWNVHYLLEELTIEQKDDSTGR